jgi:CRISPR-associated protein Cas2
MVYERFTGVAISKVLYQGEIVMYLVLYDIESDKIRTKFAKYLERYGRRLQYSVFEIKNSPRILDNIRVDIKNIFESEFGQGDSVLIFSVSDSACVGRFGYPVNEDMDLVIG